MPSPFEIGSALIHLMTLLDEYTYTVGSSAVVATGVVVVSSLATAIVVVVLVALALSSSINRDGVSNRVVKVSQPVIIVLDGQRSITTTGTR